MPPYGSASASWLMAAFLGFLKPAAADVYSIILKGSVVMPDRSPPPSERRFSASVRIMPGLRPVPPPTKRSNISRAWTTTLFRPEPVTCAPRILATLSPRSRSRASIPLAPVPPCRRWF